MLDLEYYLSFGSLFAPRSVIGIATHELRAGYYPHANRLLLEAAEYYFCAEGNGITAAITEFDTKLMVSYNAGLKKLVGRTI